MNYLALDLEMNQPSGKIIEIGISIGSRNTPKKDFINRYWIIDPQEPIAEHITTLTGIDDNRIKNESVPVAQAITELKELIEEYKPFVNPVVWGQGDADLLLSLIKENNIEFPYFGRRTIDVKTIHVFMNMSKGKSHSGGLSSVMGQYKLQFIGNKHSASDDAYNTLLLYFHLLTKQQKLFTLLDDAKNI